MILLILPASIGAPIIAAASRRKYVGLFLQQEFLYAWLFCSVIHAGLWLCRTTTGRNKDVLDSYSTPRIIEVTCYIEICFYLTLMEPFRYIGWKGRVIIISRSSSPGNCCSTWAKSRNFVSAHERSCGCGTPLLRCSYTMRFPCRRGPRSYGNILDIGDWSMGSEYLNSQVGYILVVFRVLSLHPP
ncbi:hypothetical protein EDD17DRAFT_945839 [Pisolithus thermaeus]|nr:hypothetical protein EDD17DRAFT_945839 [Pisolithus thermaeus]